jgi:hypothetical protein
MPVDRPRAAPVDLRDHRRDGVLDSAVQSLELLQPLRQLAIVERREAAVGAEAVDTIEICGTGIGQRRTDLDAHLGGRTHVPIMTEGCNSPGPRRDDQLGGCDSSRSTA